MCIYVNSFFEDGALSFCKCFSDCSNRHVHDIGRDGIVLLLKRNQGSHSLLQWTLQKCYTGSPLVSTGCFISIFSAFPYM